MVEKQLCCTYLSVVEPARNGTGWIPDVPAQGAFMMRLEADEEEDREVNAACCQPHALPTHHDTFTHDMLYKLRDP